MFEINERALTAKRANRILLSTLILSIGLQYLLLLFGNVKVLDLVLSTQLTILLIPIVSTILFSFDPAKELRIRPIGFKTVIFAFLAVICSYPIISMLNLISMFFVENAVVEMSVNIYQRGYLFSMLIMAVLPAVGEELLMRGIVYNGYKTVSPKAAWILSAVLFGLYHMNFNQMPYAIFLGLLFVVMMEASDSILTKMLMHFFINGLSTTVGYFSSFDADMEAASASMTAGEILSMLPSVLIMAVVMFPLLCLVIRAVFKVNGRSFKEVFRKKETEDYMENGPEVVERDSIGGVCLILSIGIMAVMTLLNTFA